MKTKSGKKRDPILTWDGEIYRLSQWSAILGVPLKNMRRIVRHRIANNLNPFTGLREESETKERQDKKRRKWRKTTSRLLCLFHKQWNKIAKWMS